MITKEDVLLRGATEAPHTGKYVDHHDTGVYYCQGCDAPLFESTEKFDSKSGWPSFKKPVKGALKKKMDFSHGMARMEVLCKKCDGHLGHLFPDGPLPTLQRYCVNSLALKFRKK